MMDQYMDEIDELKKLYSEGITMSVIGKKIGKSTSWVGVKVKELIDNGELKKREKKFKKEEYDPKVLEEVKTLYEKGVSYLNIGYKIGKSNSWVSHRIKEMVASGSLEKREVQVYRQFATGH